MLALGFIGLTLLMAAIIVLGYNIAIKKVYQDEKLRRKKLLRFAGFLGLWLVYCSIVAKSGFFADFSFPPRFVIFMILPAFAIGSYCIYSIKDSQLLAAIPQSWLVFYQSFRIIVETLFVGAVAQEVLTYIVTVEGYNKDMLFAFTAPVIGFLFASGRIGRKMAIAWNVFGLIVIAFIIFLFQTAIYYPELYGTTETQMPLAFATFPYALVAGFLMPSAVIIHVLSIVQLVKNKKPI